VRDARGQFGSRTSAWWVGAVTAIVLLRCGCALAAEPRVLLLRGFLGVFSSGMDSLADELKANGINAEVRRHLYWTAAVSEILRDRAAGKVGTLILVGHSQGANDAIEIAQALQISHVPVDLLVAIAPYGQKPVPANVARAIDYYQGGGWGLPLIPDAGFHGKLVNIDLANDPTISHFNIDKNDRIHAEVLREILALPQASPPLPKRRAPRR
jgi:hypothetical protein